MILLADAGVFSCDAAAYARELGGDVEALPSLRRGDESRYAGALDDRALRYRTADGAELVPVRPMWDDPLLMPLHVWPEDEDSGELGPVAPPSFAIELRPEPAGTSMYVSFERGRWSIFAPGIVQLPVWIAGAPVDAVVASTAIRWPT